MAGYEPLAWDSEFFGFPIGRIRDPIGTDGLADAVVAADAEGVRCLYLLCPATDHERMEAAIDLRFRPYDVRIELDRHLDNFVDGPAEVRSAATEDGPDLERIARTRMTGTRFWNDPNFPRERVADLYAAWVRRGLTTPPDRLTFVSHGGEGFVICHFDQDTKIGSIELIAVAATIERRGFGGDLVAAADRAFADAGMSKATVVTQASNIAAQRLYQRCGYRTSRADVWLHRWSD